MAQFWDTDPDNAAGVLTQWDKIFLNSVELPGICFPNASPKRQIDRRKGRGKHHGGLFDLGHELTEFSFRHRIWREDQWVEWERVKRNLDPTEITDEDKRYFSIFNPALKDANVTQVYLSERSNWISVNGDVGGGIKECVWKGYIIRKPKDVGNEQAGSGKQPQLKTPGDAFQDIQPPDPPSAQGIYPSDG